MKKKVMIGVCLLAAAIWVCEPAAAWAAETAAQGSEMQEETVSKSLDDETFSAVVEFIKEKWDAGELETQEDIREAIQEGEREFDFDLNQEAEDMIVSAVEAVQKLGLDSDALSKKAKELYDTYGDSIVENAEKVLKEQIVDPAKEAMTETAKAAAKNFWTDLKNSVVNFVKNIFHI